MATIVVQVRAPDAFAPATFDVPGPVIETARRLGLSLTPQFGQATDPELARYFVAEAPPTANVEAAAEALRGLSEVDAAYVQPEPSLPGL
jgi:hypothetical protein